MRNLILILFVALYSVTIAQETIKVKVCDKTSITENTKKGTIEIIKLTDNELKNIYLATTNDNYKVVSFTCGAKFGADYKEAKGKGSRLPVVMSSLIRKEETKAFYLENIIISNNNGDTIKAPSVKVIRKD